MPYILLLADEPYGTRLKSDLEYIGHEVQYVLIAPGTDSGPAPDTTPLRPVDLILIDVGPQLAHLEATIQELRKNRHTKETPLLIAADENCALSLDFALGITDFIVKPYSLREMEARLRLVLWHSDRLDDEHTVKIEDLVINLSRYEVRVKGIVIELTLKEYELLKHMVSHRGRVFTRADLLDSIWGYDYYGGMRTVDVHIRRLRSKLEAMGSAIKTVRGVGYSFDWP
ncbi:MAG: response regulator transcription factor [bacterium]|nr:response regulator transcription factor [bacterium]